MVSLPIQRLSDSGAAGNPLRRCLFRPVTFRAVSSAAATLSQHPTQHNSTIVAPHKPTKPLRRTSRFKPNVPPDGPVQQAGRQRHRWDTGFVLFSSHSASGSRMHLTFSTSSFSDRLGLARISRIPRAEGQSDRGAGPGDFPGQHRSASHTPVAHHHHRFSAPFRLQTAGSQK